MTPTNDRFGRVAREAVVLVVVLLLAASTALAQERATGEGVKVHGHWTIDVKNPDGTLVSHHEFENALVQTGQNLLSSVLAHKGTVVGWAVLLDDSGGIPQWIIAEPQLQQQPPFGSPLFPPQVTTPNLTATTGTPQQTVLQGSVQAVSSLSIATVQTMLAIQISGQPLGGDFFSQRALPQTITVQAGQIAQVTVVFSFS
jgi:hypothetical protein